MTWRVEFDDRAAKELRSLDKAAQSTILKFLRERLSTDSDPRRFGKPLSRELSGLWRYRIADYRIICSLENDACIVLVVKVGYRKDVYH